jgi:UDP:flavonoid glycosyltransferase YjiC (YdhE family)
VRILFTTFGSLGDLHPYIAIAFEAKKRGHTPVFATAPKYRAKIEALGFEFRAVRPDLPEENDFAPMAKRVMDLKDGPRYLFQDILSPALRDSYADMLAASEDADILISHPAVLTGPLVAQKTGKKWLSSVLGPISLWSKSDPPVPPTVPQLDFLRFLGPIWPTIMFAMGRVGTQPWIAEVDQLRHEMGIESLGHPMFEGQFSPHGTLALFSRHFVAPQTDWPVNTTATGFCFYDAKGYEKQTSERKGEASWEGWMREGDAPIVFALGSSAVFDAGPFWEQSEILAKGRRQRGVFLTGGQNPFEGRRLSGELLELDYAPYSELFPLAKMVVHQGGAGTTAQALRAGVPQLIVPHAHDQPDHAARITRLGVGKQITLEKYSHGGAHRVLRQVLDNYPRLKRTAQGIGEKIRAENGPLVACEAIEKAIERAGS